MIVDDDEAAGAFGFLAAAASTTTKRSVVYWPASFLAWLMPLMATDGGALDLFSCQMDGTRVQE